MLKKKKTMDEKKNPVKLSNNRYKKRKKQKQDINIWYPAEFLYYYCLISRIITWCLRLGKSHKDSQISFILEEGPVASILNENGENFRRVTIWTLYAFANDLNSFRRRSSMIITFLYIELCRTKF